MTDSKVILGKISGVHGIQGWVKVYSYTRPPEHIFAYPRWQLQQGANCYGTRSVLEHRKQGRKLLVRLQGVDTRSLAEQLVDQEIAVDAEELPALEGEYYWRELIGMTVRDPRGRELGQVVDLMETGSNDVLLLRDGKGRSLAIPWLPEVVLEVDTTNALLVADWEPLV